MVTVVCWKWSDGKEHPKKKLHFSFKHVNVFRAGVERNTTIPYRFVCVTDDWRGLHSSVEVIPIQENFSKLQYLGGCYRRLRSFNEEDGLRYFGERFISFDIDSVVLGNLDYILSFDEGFRIWGDKVRRKTPYCGSLWGMKAGARQWVWDKFIADPNLAILEARKKGMVGTDQAHISACLYPHEVTWGMDDGIYNFNTQIRKVPSKVYRVDNKVIVEHRRNGDPPKNSRIIFFNGKFDPSHPHLQASHSWIGDLWRE